MKARILALALCCLSATAFAAWHSVLQISVGGSPPAPSIMLVDTGVALLVDTGVKLLVQ